MSLEASLEGNPPVCLISFGARIFKRAADPEPFWISPTPIVNRSRKANDQATLSQSDQFGGRLHGINYGGGKSLKSNGDVDFLNLDMNCNDARTFLTQVNDRAEPITPVPQADLNFLSSNGYVQWASKDDHDKAEAEVARLSDLVAQVNTEKAAVEQADEALDEDRRKEHSFMFHFEKQPEQAALHQKVQSELAATSKEGSELTALETHVNQLIQEKSTLDRMAAYGGGYVSLTGVGTVTLSDLNVRNYRLAQVEFSDFAAELKATYSELLSIAERAKNYLSWIRPSIPKMDEEEDAAAVNEYFGRPVIGAPSLLWATSIGLAKLQGDFNQIGARFIQAFNLLKNFDSTTENKLMAAEVMTASSSREIASLESDLVSLVKQLRDADVPKELTAGTAAVILAGRRFDGTYPIDRFTQFNGLSLSCEAAAIMAVMNVPYADLEAKFQSFRALLNSWGYMRSEDTEIASAFLAIGELSADEIQSKLQYLVDQLRNYLEYPLVASAILASIPVFEAHEALDLMEKAVTLLSSYAVGLERSELVALAVRMIHGVRNEVVKEIDSTAKIAQTPVQFTYAPYPLLWFRFYPVIVAHSAYHATFSGMGGFHPAHSHGIGGFAG